MRWVKASERLPEDKKQLVCMRGDGGGCYHYETADWAAIVDRQMDDHNAQHKYDPEWLDESTESIRWPTDSEWKVAFIDWAQSIPDKEDLSNSAIVWKAAIQWLKQLINFLFGSKILKRKTK